MPFAGEIHYQRTKVKTKGNLPLVLIHGAGGTHLYWPPELRRLAGEDVLAIDLPGHGNSSGEARDSINAYAEDVHKFLNHLGIEQVVIGGHSMGSAIAMELCLEHPEVVKGLILVGSGARYQVNPTLIQYCDIDDTYPQAVQFIERFSFSKSTDKRLVELATKKLAETPASTLHTDFIACDGYDIRHRLGEISPPTLIVCGEEDKMMPVSSSQLLAENIPNSRLEIVPSAGHMVMLEKPEAVARLVKEFLEQFHPPTTDLG